MSTLFSFLFTLILGDPADTGNESIVFDEDSIELDGEVVEVESEPSEEAEEADFEADDLKVIVISDLNSQYGSLIYNKRVHHAVEKIIQEAPDVILITGDMVAGQKLDLPYRAMWKSFHSVVTRPLQEAGIPVMVTPGNHDASFYFKFAEERKIFTEEWKRYKPKVQYIDDTHYPLRYAFMVENTLFVSLDDTRPGSLGKEQEEWLDEVLDTEAKSKIVFGHLPLYPFVQKKKDEVIGDPHVEELLNKHDVKLFISGHHHAYYPGQRGSLHLLSAPCLGSGSRTLINSTEVSPRGFVRFYLRDGELEELEAWSGKDFSVSIERSTLPFYVGTEEYQIWRDDLILEQHN